MFGDIETTGYTGIFTQQGLAGIEANTALLQVISDLGKYRRGETGTPAPQLRSSYDNLARQLDLTMTDLAIFPRTGAWNNSMRVAVDAYWIDHSRHPHLADSGLVLMPVNHLESVSNYILRMLGGASKDTRELTTVSRYLTNVCAAAQMLPVAERLNGLEKTLSPAPFLAGEFRGKAA
jgi:hypothetical protein